MCCLPLSGYPHFLPGAAVGTRVNILKNSSISHPPEAQDCQYYLCGPGSFITQVQIDLQSIDVPANRIHYERFSSSTPSQNELGVAATLTVKEQQSEFTVLISQGQTLLQESLQGGHSVPFSCQGGVCGTCTCRLVSGRVSMQSNMALNEQQVQQGLILSCQAITQSSDIKIDYQN